MISPGWIGGIFIFLVFTEVIYFGWMRNYEDPFGDKSFLWNKCLSMYISLIITSIFYGIPYSMAYVGGGMGEIAYIYYYGSILCITLFFTVNYKITKYLERRDIKKGSKK